MRLIMISSLPLDKLEHLLNCQKLQLVTKQGGGNSVVYCVEGNGRKFAVKSYPPYAPNQRDRLAAELNVYQFLNQHHVPAVPQLINYSNEERWLVIDWIDGAIPQIYSESTINQSIDFLREIAKLNDLPAA